MSLGQSASVLLQNIAENSGQTHIFLRQYFSLQLGPEGFEVVMRRQIRQLAQVHWVQYDYRNKALIGNRFQNI